MPMTKFKLLRKNVSEKCQRLNQEFPYNCDFPKPLLPPAKITNHVFDKGDPALRLIDTKTRINNDIDRIVDHHRKQKKAILLKKDVKWKKEGNHNRTNLPRYVADLAETLEWDPDPYFEGKYNWYYTGGSLTTVQLGGENIFIFPYMGDLVASSIKSAEHFLWKPNLRTSGSWKSGLTIYETRAGARSDGCRLLARSKNTCVLYSLMQNYEKLRMSQVHAEKSRIPYISADLNPIDCNIFCTMNVERTLTLWDMISCKQIKSNSVDVCKVLEDKWGSVRFMKSEPNTIIFVDRCCVHYLDTRNPYKRPVLSLCPRGNLEICESLCLMVPSYTEDCNYLASYHSLLMCDRRSPQACVQQKWIHQFKSPPLLGAVHSRDEKEVIVLSSQIAGETTIIWNTWNGLDNPHSYNLPYTPPSMLDTLKESRMKGKCLNPSLTKRLELSIVGISMAVDMNGDLVLFLQNSIGDIFYQCITRKEALDNYSLVNCQAYYAMEAWDKRISLHDRPIISLVITDRTSMCHVFDDFTNKNLRLEPETPKEFFRDPVWKKPLGKLKEYIDLLAPELLAIWEVTENDVPVARMDVPHVKVLNWLEMADDEYSGRSREDDDIMKTLISTQELVSASQQPEVIDIAEDLPQESYCLPVKVKTRRKLQSKKQTYVAGF